MIRVNALCKKFNDQTVLRDMTIDIQDGEIVAVLGQSGSGKSVFLQHLIGLLKPDTGTVEIDGVDITRLNEKQLLRMRKNMGYLFQEGALYDFMTVRENVAFPFVEHTSLKRAQVAQRVMDMLEMVDLVPAADKYPAQLSGGMKKRTALARSVILGSKILFCDEPTSGLDPIKSREISELIKRISRQMKSTTVITSHDIRNSLRVADRLVLIDEGAVVVQGTPAELQRSSNAMVKDFLNG